jgi:aminopeptidase N
VISLSDTEQLTDSRGRPLHGRALQVAQAGERRRQAEAEQAATVRALARAVVQLLARGAASGPDVLRSLIGPGDALRVLRLAGLNAEVVAGNWDGQAPRQATTQLNGGWAADPDHDPRVTEVMRRPGATLAEINAVRAQVAAEYAARAAEKAARREPAVLWHTRDGIPVVDGTAPLGVSLGPGGAPVQSSRVSESVPPLGSEESHG